MSATVYDRYLSTSDKDRPVIHVVPTASGTVSTVNDMPNIFHWRLYLVLAADPSSPSQAVVLDMQPANFPIGTMIITSSPESASKALVKSELTILTAGSPTVGQIINVFLQHNMDRFRFDDTGSGCLHWMWTGVQHLETAGLVEFGAIEKLRKFHEEEVASHPERHPMPIRQGQFY